MDKTANTNHNVLEEIKNRWSPRAFSDEEVTDAELAEIFEAARWAASSYNEQPWRYLVASKKRDPETYEKIFNCFNEFNRSWAESAPVVGLSFAKNHFGDDAAQTNHHARHDVGAASAQMSLQAAKLDLFVHQMAGLEPETIEENIDAPENFNPVAGFVIGHVGDANTLPHDLKEQEEAARERKPQADFVFSSWGEAADFEA